MDLIIDFGATNFRYLIDDEIKSIKSKDVDILDFLEYMISKYTIKNIAISIAAQVRDGVILDAPNIDIKNLDIKNIIESKYGINLYIENDLNAAALYESSLYEEKNIAVLYIGTGFGASFVIDKKVLSGGNNFAGEIGHIPFKKTPFRCGCGRDDCLELSVSGKALSLWSEHLSLDIENTTLETLKKCKNQAVYHNFLDGLKHAYFTILNLFDPELIVFGGSVMLNNKNLIDELEKSFKNCSFSHIRKKPKIVISDITNGALYGAKMMIK